MRRGKSARYIECHGVLLNSGIANNPARTEAFRERLRYGTVFVIEDRGVVAMATAAPQESFVSVMYGRYESGIADQAATLLTGAGFALEDEDSVIDVLPIPVHARTDAAINAYLEANGIHDRDDKTEVIIEEVFRTGLRFHGIVTALGKCGIKLAVVDRENKARFIEVGTLTGDDEAVSDDDPHQLSLVVDSLQAKLHQAVAEDQELALLTATGNPSARTQYVGMHALNMAMLAHEVGLTHEPAAKLMNRGAQLYCILAAMQAAGGRLCFVDQERYWLPVTEDLNAAASAYYFET